MGKYFVATTALEDFWDISYPIVFLGEWCKRYSRKSYWGPMGSATLESTMSEQGVFEAVNYLQDVYERLLPVLAKALNDFHGVSFSVRYWRIVIGSWLLFYLHTMHDKYAQVMDLKKKYPDFTTTCLEESCFVVPEDSFMFACLMKGDTYNLQLYSQLFDSLGYKFPNKKKAVEVDSDVKIFSVLKPKMINKLLFASIDLSDRIFFKRKKIIFESIYFQKPALLKLMLKMKGRFLPFTEGRDAFHGLEVNDDARSRISCIEFGETEYERMLLPLIGRSLPKSLLEGFSRYRDSIRQKCIHPPKAIMSAVGWYFNEQFKMFAAEAAEKGAMLLGVQHGGGYGMLEYHFTERYELSITDKFFSWGWTRNDCYAKVKPVSATKLVNDKQIKSDKKSDDILYITDVYFRYMLVYPRRTDCWRDYLDKQSIFLFHLSKDVKKRLVIRPHREDGGMDYKERFREIIPDVKIETWAQPFSEREYRLLVCDHPYYSTTIIESMVNNKPTILFTNPHLAANHLNERAKIFCQKLKDAGILYDDPVEASKKISEIYENVDDWWNQPERQEVVRLFLSEFGKVSEHWDKEWVEVLESILV